MTSEIFEGKNLEKFAPPSIRELNAAVNIEIKCERLLGHL